MLAYGKIDIDQIKKDRKKKKTWTDDLWTGYFCNHQDKINLYGENHILDPLKKDSDFNIMEKLVREMKKTGQKLSVSYYDDTAAVVGYNSLYFVIPSEYVTMEYLKDYDGLDPKELALTTGGSQHSLAMVGNDSKNDLEKRKEEAERALCLMKKRADDITSGQAEELSALKKQMEELQARMEEKKAALMEDLNRKKTAMEEKISVFEKQLFMLETQIYGLRCYLGEVVHFYTIRDGKPAKTEDPVIIFQKLRFLDEELGRYLSLYQFGDHDDDKETFLDILKTRDDIVDILAPAKKGISVVKVSRTGKAKTFSEVFANILEEYELMHENQLAVLIRNGEQLHIAWLDADRINYSDDNVFLTPKKNEAQSYREPDDLWRIKASEEKKNRERKEMLSRWFFFNILQGVLDNTDLLNLPDGEKITNSNYVVFNNADAWIDVNMYGSFAEMLKKSAHIPLKKGDHILTGSLIRPEKQTYSPWHNDRGIGDANRTHDAKLPAKKILQINKVIPWLTVRYTARIKKARISCDPTGQPWYRGPEGFSSYQINEDYVFDHSEPSYQFELSDDVVEEKTWEETIEAEHWYSYEHSYKKLTEENLIHFSKKTDQRPFIIKEDPFRNKHEVYIYDKKKEVFEKELDLYYYDFVKAEIVGLKDYDYYCSVEQEGWNKYGETRYWVNLKIYPEEMIPLEFLCSTWVKEVIRTGNIGTYRLCSTYMSFSDMLPYLKKILCYLTEKEKDEKEIIKGILLDSDKWFENHPDWNVYLTEWKIKNKYKKLTKTRAKSFISSLL